MLNERCVRMSSFVGTWKGTIAINGKISKEKVCNTDLEAQERA